MPARSQSPATRLDPDKRRLLLQTAGAYMNVESETRIDMDSGFMIAARSFNLGRCPLITEGLAPLFVSQYGGWIDRNDLRTAKKTLTNTSADLRAAQEVMIGAWYAFQPARDLPARDSALAYLEHAQRSPAWRRQALILMEKVYFKAGDTTRGLICLRDVVADCKRTGDKAAEARAWNFMGSYYPYFIDVMPKRLAALDKALPLYRQLKDTANESLCLTYQGYMQVPAKNLTLAKECAEQAARLQQAYHFPYVHYVEDLLGYLYLATYPRRETLDQALTTLRNAEAVKDTLILPYLLGRTGDFYGTEGEKYDPPEPTLLATAVTYLDSALNILEARHVSYSVYPSLFLISTYLEDLKEYDKATLLITRIQQEMPPESPIDAQRLAHILARDYQAMHENVLAEKYYLEVIQLEPLAQKIRGDLREANIYNAIADFYFEIGAYAKARPYFIKTLNAPTFKSLGIFGRADTYRSLAAIDSAAGNFVSAYQFMCQYTRTQDTIYHLSESKQVDSLRTLFATAQKEKDNALLRAQSATQQKELDRDTLIRNASFGGLLLLLLIIVLVVNRYNIKQRTAHQLERQKQEIDEKNQELEKLLQSKEWLLSEIHHRVKNNLQIMMNLLNLQAGSVQNEEAISAIRDSQHRLHAMSLIHQKLYQTADKQLIEISGYIREFVSALHDNFHRGSSVRVRLDLIPLQLDISQAIPLALILNEAVTNVYKYAFEDLPAGTPRILNISLQYLDDGKTIELRIADNGKGLPAGAPGKNSLGISLMRGLSEQLHGTLDLENNNGVVVTVRFAFTSPL